MHGQYTFSRLTADDASFLDEMIYQAISLSVWPNNPAYRLYRRYGFEFVRAEAGGGAVTMLKRLS
jgi:ribosomal protein S18 acetylase RimI-like enzyme